MYRLFTPFSTAAYEFYYELEDALAALPSNTAYLVAQLIDPQTNTYLVWSNVTLEGFIKRREELYAANVAAAPIGFSLSDMEYYDRRMLYYKHYGDEYDGKDHR